MCRSDNNEGRKTWRLASCRIAQIICHAQNKGRISGRNAAFADDDALPGLVQHRWNKSFLDRLFQNVRRQHALGQHEIVKCLLVEVVAQRQLRLRA